MRGLEYLMQCYPDATVKEIIAIQEQEKLDDQKEFEERNKKKLAFIKDINTNGGYYRGRFGYDQHYYYNVHDLVMDKNGVVTMSVDSIVLFCNNDNHKHTVCSPNDIRLERKFKDYAELDKYGLDAKERVTVKEWDAINAYLDAMSTGFWEALPK